MVHNVVDIQRRHGGVAPALQVPPGYSGSRAVLETMLNEVLATELACGLRYRRYSLINDHPLIERVKSSFLHFAQVQQEQADRLAERILQLGGTPHVDPSDLAARSQSRHRAGMDLQDMVGEDLLFVRTAMETYEGMVRYLEKQDLTTARMLVMIRAVHEAHAAELAALFTGLTPPL
jgi:bacterioferritin